MQDKTYWEKRERSDDHRDWGEKSNDWIEGYFDSRNHPHRDIILKALEGFIPFESVLEVWCNCGPNLYRIQDEFPMVQVYGVDVNNDVLDECNKNVLGVITKQGSATDIPFKDHTADIAISDAVLLYVGPDEIRKAIEEMIRVSQKGIILVEWESDSLLGEEKFFHWARDYKKLLEGYGYTVHKIKITESVWPTKSWSTLGHVYVCHRAY